MIRIAAVGDIHFDRLSHGKLSPHIETLPATADILLLAGDLTQSGHVDEAQVLADDLQHVQIPIVAVLGNHDYHLDQEDQITAVLREAGVHVLEGSCIEFQLKNASVGIAGIKGFGGGYLGACGSEFGEPEMKAFVHHTKEGAALLKKMLMNLNAQYKIALLHYSPVPDTLHGERKEIYPFLGSYLLAEAIDQGKADIAFHGHAHKGVEKGTTLGGIPVRNVALPVIQHAFNVYTLNKDALIQTPSHMAHEVAK